MHAAGLLGASTGLPIATLLLVELIIYVLICFGSYGFFKKAGQPGWAAFVPFYNWYIVLKIVGRPGWWLALYLVGFIPLVGTIVLIVLQAIICGDLARSFGHGTGFAVLLFFFFPILAYVLSYGSSVYRGPAALGGRGGPGGGYGYGPPNPPYGGGYGSPPYGGPPAQQYPPPYGAPPPPYGQPPAAPPPYGAPPAPPPPYGQPPASPPSGATEGDAPAE